MTEAQLREIALTHARQDICYSGAGGVPTAKEVLKRAEEYLKFLKGKKK